ncbi:hypothetical protein ERJ75_000718100 [Trypanosoma vivax]|uniref:Uncharacterized protein n=1 Tax=Trypanosoma vivax (strain Y486) TaxID=1055687 RepID=G0TWR0_TRYVY|nr:hypothetical protein ERJ75_000718100 [Trypanosoma vivax]CCC48398.1 conserved hypothetical protein [Trypanosoma vivax Y486]
MEPIRYSANDAKNEEEVRNVRPRVSSPVPTASHNTRSWEHSGNPKAVIPEPVSSTIASSGKGSMSFVTDMDAWRSSVGGVETIFDETQRCWEEYYNTGRMHTKPPWCVCSKAESNREHPWFIMWLDTVELPPLEELLAPSSHSQGADAH